jgi:DNA polymerase family B
VKVVGLLQSELFGTYIFNTPPPAMDSSYEGATVIDTHRGYYGKPDEQVILLDFAS